MTEYRIVMDACNELSDIMETWDGVGIEDVRLYAALSKVREMLEPVYKAGMEAERVTLETHP